MQFDAQIQMIVSTFKLAQSLEFDPSTLHASMRYLAKCQGGAKANGFMETQAVISIREATDLASDCLGLVKRQQETFYVDLVAPRDYFTGLIHLFPYCQPEQGGYLSFDILVNYESELNEESEVIKVLSAQYKMVKQLSSNSDLISR